tara:strand:+ start:952 stop:1137 length:186 start_codon:yes stop_codon:yes gene_type:complete
LATGKNGPRKLKKFRGPSGFFENLRRIVQKPTASGPQRSQLPALPQPAPMGGETVYGGEIQ